MSARCGPRVDTVDAGELQCDLDGDAVARYNLITPIVCDAGGEERMWSEVHRLTVGVTVVLTIVALAIPGATQGSTPAAILCVRQAQTDLKACQTLARQTVDQCTVTYFSAVPPCFGANAPCASDCITARTSCETDPKDRQTACAATCDQRAKNFQNACKGRPTNAAQTCLLAAKVKSLKCKQKCARAAAIPLERCGLDFKSCLPRCAALGGS